MTTNDEIGDAAINVSVMMLIMMIMMILMMMMIMMMLVMAVVTEQDRLQYWWMRENRDTWE